MIGRCKQKTVMIHLSHKGGACRVSIILYRARTRELPLYCYTETEESSDYFSHQIEHFSKTYRVIAVDTRGAWKISKGRRSFYIGTVCGRFKTVAGLPGIEKDYFAGF